MQTEIKVYAPVIIPTLNRYEHFKRCLESLERCTGAEKTSVYVALDYPPSDKYAEGWKKIASYLESKESSNGFDDLIVIRRDRNFGICHENGNYETLVREIMKQYDRYILSEDDNEFSPCFLEYMNHNLEKYKYAPDVFCVCGYLSMKDECDSRNYTQFKSERYVAWGVGFWTSKYYEYTHYTNQNNVLELIEPAKVQEYYLKDKRESILSSVVAMSRGALILGDVTLGTYLRLKNMHCILPTKSKVRNHGWDGSGSHGGIVNGYSSQEIDTNKVYVMVEAPQSFGREYDERMHQRRRSRKLTLNEQAGRITWYLYKYTGIFCQFKGLHDFCKNIKNKLHGNK